VTALKVLAFDLVYHSADWHSTLLNETFASLIMLVFGFGTAAYLYSRSQIGEPERHRVIPALILAANILALVALTVEPIGYFTREAARLSAPASDELLRLNNWMHFTLTGVWTLYAAVALAIGFRRNSQSVRLGAILLLGFSVIKLVVVDAAFYTSPWHPLGFNQTFAAFALVIAALAFANYLYGNRETDDREHRLIPAITAGTANVLAVAGLSLEAMGYFGRAAARAAAAGAQPDQLDAISNWKHFVLTALWSLFAAVVLVAAFRKNSKYLRAGALLLVGLTTLKVLFIDLGYSDASWHALVFNQTFGAFALLIAAMSLAVFYYSRSATTDDEERKYVVPVLIASANVLAIIALSAEAQGHFAGRLRNPSLDEGAIVDLQLAQQLSISVIWTVYGGAMLAVGMWRRNRMLRLMALLLLSLTIVKVFLFDLASLEKIYRTISFIVLGLILVAVSYLYQRYRQRTSELEPTDDEPAPEQAR
jgi:uncharacterized membrane protein